MRSASSFRGNGFTINMPPEVPQRRVEPLAGTEYRFEVSGRRRLVGAEGHAERFTLSGNAAGPTHAVELARASLKGKYEHIQITLMKCDGEHIDMRKFFQADVDAASAVFDADLFKAGDSDK